MHNYDTIIYSLCLHFLWEFVTSKGIQPVPKARHMVGAKVGGGAFGVFLTKLSRRSRPFGRGPTTRSLKDVLSIGAN